jgi:hypothetical protein
MPVQGVPARRHPVRTVTIAVLVATALVQGLVAWSVASRSWWSSEWVRLQLHHVDPTAPFAQHPQPHPGWRDWVPSATTSVLITAALVLLALLVVRVGRSWWLLAVALLPLVPTELAPGTWAPPLSNQLAYGLVWPAGSTDPDTAWAWVSAGITFVLVALPAATLAVSRTRRPYLSPGLVLGRLLPVGLVAAAWLGWRAYNGVPADALLAGWRTILVVVGALAATGLVRRGQVLAVLAVLPALAAGAVRWTTGVDGVPQLETDAMAWLMSAAAVGGGVWAAYLQPRLVRGLSWVRAEWHTALHRDEDVEPDERPDEDGAAVATGGLPAEERDAAGTVDLAGVDLLALSVPDDLSELGPERIRIDGTDEAAQDDGAEAVSAVSRRRGRAASGRSGGRHRA